MNNKIIIGLSLLVCIIIGMFSHKFFGKDNILEETSESFIEKMTGYKHDFTEEDPYIRGM